MKMKLKPLINVCFLILIFSLEIESVDAKSNITHMQQRLEKLSEQLNTKRKDLHIPGMAIAIVKDNKVILIKGFGVSDLETNKAVNSKTLFGIGSTTKAFTATLIGMLADEDKIQWDDPIIKHLPYLKFNLENKSDEITIRDMMSHQTGFTRFNLLYANGKVDREEILHAAIKAEPWDGFRENFHYTNLMVSGAGVAAAKSAGTDWDSLLEERLLNPLGMINTTSRYEIAQQNKQLSNGYMWLEEQDKHKQISMHNITNIGPAGAINSNVEDMAKWLQLQLGNGVYNGKRIISQQQIQQTRSPQIKISSKAHYGLGWMLRDYKDQKLVAHDGSVEGYSAIVAMLPESNLGYVLLTNVTQTALLGASVGMVFETLLDETKNETVVEENEHISYEKYIGEYIANFGSFKEAVFNFHVKEETAYVDVPGQMDYELKAPDKDGKMFFAITDTISISFDKDKSGKVTALRMQQDGMNFELQKKGVPIMIDIEELELQKFLGSYASTLFKGDIKALIQNHRLAIDVPGKMIFELHIPDVNNRRHFRIKDSMSITFEINENDKVTALNVYRGDKKLDTAQKATIKNNDKDNLPTVADILQLRNTEQRKKALLNSGGFRMKGKLIMKQSGVLANVTSIFQGYHEFREDVNFGKYGSITTVMNADGAAMAPSFSDFREHHGKYLEQTQKMHPASMIDWQKYYKKIQVIDTSTFMDRKVYVVKLIGDKIPASKILIDVETGDVLKQEIKMLDPTVGSIPVTTIYENYQDIHGLRMPYKVTVKNDFNGELTIELDSIENNLSFKPSNFILKNPNTGE